MGSCCFVHGRSRLLHLFQSRQSPFSPVQLNLHGHDGRRFSEKLSLPTTCDNAHEKNTPLPCGQTIPPHNLNRVSEEADQCELRHRRYADQYIRTDERNRLVNKMFYGCRRYTHPPQHRSTCSTSFLPGKSKITPSRRYTTELAIEGQFKLENFQPPTPR